MSAGQILRRVELPLALPLIVEGPARFGGPHHRPSPRWRILSAREAWARLSSAALTKWCPTLSCWGAIPIILLALLADGILRAVGILLTPRGIR